MLKLDDQGLAELAEWTVSVAAGTAVLVIGDMFVDGFAAGRVVKESGELPGVPCPVIRTGPPGLALGGAGNVAALLRGLGCCVTLVAATGPDWTGVWARMELHRRKIDYVYVESNFTIAKQRVLSDGGCYRHDVEEGFGLVRAAESDNGHWPRPSEYDVVVVSDYAKGMVHSSRVPWLAACGRPVLVDPKAADWRRYQGAALIKANHAEWRRWRQWCRRHGVAGQAARPAARTAVTLGRRGLVIERAPDQWEHVAGVPVTVADTIGAGDAAMAGMAATWPAGDPVRAAQAGVLVAAYSVTRPGTGQFTASQLTRWAGRRAGRG